MANARTGSEAAAWCTPPAEGAKHTHQAVSISVCWRRGKRKPRLGRRHGATLRPLDSHWASQCAIPAHRERTACGRGKPFRSIGRPADSDRAPYRPLPAQGKARQHHTTQPADFSTAVVQFGTNFAFGHSAKTGGPRNSGPRWADEPTRDARSTAKPGPA